MPQPSIRGCLKIVHIILYLIRHQADCWCSSTVQCKEMKINDKPCVVEKPENNN